MISLVCAATAHEPDRKNRRIWPRFDLIPPLGVRLPAEHSRLYNRPTNLSGWLAYRIAPSSQEAMAWHNATHQRAYQDDRGRLEKHFFYPKPWEGLRVGPRDETAASRNAIEPITSGELREALRADEEKLARPRN